MKILHIITSMRTGGAEKLVADMLPIFKQQGNMADLLLFDGAETPFKQKLQEQNINIYSFGVNNFIYNLLFIFKLLPFLKNYDIIHTHNTACQLFVAVASLFVAPKNRAKLVTTEHSTTNRRRNIKFLKLIDRWMYSKYDCIAAISTKAQENLITHLDASTQKIVTIHNGINLKNFNKKAKEAKDTKEVKIVMVARFMQPKDQKTAIRALKLMPQEYHLYLVGDGELRHEAETYVQALSLTDRVHFLGIRKDIPDILQASDIVVMSSQYEGLSLSSIEGMASGCPFIASDVDGLHEITDGAGILFPYGDEKSLAKEILHLMNDKEYYEYIVKRCRERASFYSIEKCVDNYMNIYKELTR